MPSKKKGNPTMPNSPSIPRAYLLAARPNTWIASISPVLIGTILAIPHTQLNYSVFALTLLFSLFIQIGTNFANDAFDFLKGADTPDRKGPARATSQGWISVRAMFISTGLIFVLAFLAAIPLMSIAGLWSLSTVIVCVALGVFYTGGPRPLGYFGLGEVLVFIFFGPVATCGTYYLQTLSLDPSVVIASLAPGLLSCSLIIANNLRDAETDQRANKQTLVVRFGITFGRWEYVTSIVLAAFIPLILVTSFGAPPRVALTSSVLLLAAPQLKQVLTSDDFIPLLQGSNRLLWFYTILFLQTTLL
jgi:1,4-dihydroxy-2-naphthoate octaprenyltransferase